MKLYVNYYKEFSNYQYMLLISDFNLFSYFFDQFKKSMNIQAVYRLPLECLFNSLTGSFYEKFYLYNINISYVFYHFIL